MNEIQNQNSTFEDIKHIDEYGNEYWLARELQRELEYKEWRKFEGVIEKAKDTCNNSNINVYDHFVEAAKMSCEQSQFIIDDHFTQVGKMV